MENERNAAITLRTNVIMKLESHCDKLFNWYNYLTGLLKNYTHISVLLLLK